MFTLFGSKRLCRLRRTSIAAVAILAVVGLGLAFATRADAAGQAITSTDNATAVAGSMSSFTVTTSGIPVPSIKEKGKLPRGVKLTDEHNGTASLAGTPSLTTGGVYPRPIGGVYDVTIDATFGAGPTKQVVTQAFAFTVDQAPTITSRATRNARVGASFSFSVRTRGYPKPTFNESGPLPSGVTFTNNGNGRATVAGTPGHGSAETYSITIRALNGVGSPASQHFTLMVRS